MKKKLSLIIGVSIIVAATAALIWLQSRPQQDVLTKLLPTQDYPVANVQYFLQNDERWAGDTLGSSSYKMSGSGCLVSCIATSLEVQGIDTDPGRLNKLFGEHGVYNEDGEVIWNEITDVFPNVQVEIPSQVDTAKLEKALTEGLYPIVKVRYQGLGYQHWVLLIGSSDGDYLCMDPLNSSKKPLSLSRHGGEIYRYRIVRVN